MKFRTEVDIKTFTNTMTHADFSFSVGSCFSDNIGNRLKRYQLQCMANPFGVLFNAGSIVQNMLHCLNDTKETDSDFIFHNDLWHSWNYHGQFSREDKSELQNIIASTTQKTKEHLLKSKYIFITLGTSWVYKYIPTQAIVANCHKVPNNQFEKVFLSPSQNIIYLQSFVKEIQCMNANVSIIFTVSPIRHWRDGAYENSVSKSSLFLAIDSIVKEYSFCHYFPSYELVIDELRDYRFYKSDMLHPSDQAVDYVWEKFSETFISKESQEANKELDKVLRLIEHRPLQSSQNQTNKTAEIIKNKKRELMEKYPFFSFDVVQ